MLYSTYHDSKLFDTPDMRLYRLSILRPPERGAHCVQMNFRSTRIAARCRDSATLGMAVSILHGLVAEPELDVVQVS